MAAGSPVHELAEELTCSVCLEYFRDPVMLTECGHNFCRACLTRTWGESLREASCPQCREIVQPGNLKPNRQLANVVEIAKKLSPQGGREGEAEGTVCEQHQEPLKLFCKDDEALICVVCDKSKEHREHRVIPVEEAAQEYKVQICHCLENLRKEREKILAYKTETEKESEDLLKQTEVEKQKIVYEFTWLRQFLEHQENLLLAQMNRMKREIIKETEEHLASISEPLSSLDCLIRELEEKCQQIASELLQDVMSTLQRCEQKEKFEHPVAFSPALKWKVWEFCCINPILKNIRTKLKGTLPFDCQLQKENVILDPDSAHPQLLVSDDRKCLTLGDKQQPLPTGSRRFCGWLCARGVGSLNSQMCYWDVEVGKEEGWAVGICWAHKVFQRDDSLGPRTGVWAIGKWNGGYWDPYHRPLSLSWEPKSIRVLLNFPLQQISFFDADTAALLHISTILAYPEFQPFFWLMKKSHLRICP